MRRTVNLEIRECENLTSELLLRRLMALFDARNESDLCEKSGIGRSTLGSWKSRGSLPKLAAIVDISEKTGASLDYLILGKKESHSPPSGDEEPSLGASIAAHLEHHTDRASELVSESDLSLPILRFLAAAPGGFLKTTQLIARLEALFNPTGQDAEFLKGRADTRFSQKVRNIVSHRDSANNPIAKGWIDYDTARKSLRITKAGHAVLASFTFVGSIPEYKPDQPDLFGDGD